MATAEQVLAKARSYVGYKESPAGSNKTIFGKYYGMDGEPWCDMYVSAIGDMCGERSAVGWFAYCPYHVDWFKKNGRWLDRSEKPRPGDIVFFSNGKRACHVGFVTERVGTDYVRTIEGNTSVSGSQDNGGMVCEKKRAYGKRGSSWFIMGFGRPNYSGSKKAEWVKNSTGWWYRRADGSYPKSEWEKIGGKWYHFDPKGYMQTGWLKDKGSWYWLESSGAMFSDGFKEIYSRWYGFNKDGRMVESADQMKVNDNGSIDFV